MAGPGNIMIRVGAETAAAQRELGNLKGPLDDVKTRGERMGGAVRRATLPAIAVLGGLAVAAKGAATAAAEDELAQVKLAGALERATGATSAQVAAVEAHIGKLSLATGVADDELRPAMARLATATGDVSTAQDSLALALDISAQTGKSVDAVSAALAKGYGGQTTALARLVPGIDAGILASKDMHKITDELARLTAGAASEAAQTAQGKYKRMQVQLGELQEEIGGALIPVISKMSGAVLAATEIAGRHTTAVKVVAGAIAVLAAGVLVARAGMAVYTATMTLARAATATWTAAQWLLNAALTANPVGVVVVAIAALAAGLVLAYRRSETFRDAVNRAWAVIRNSPLALAISHMDSLAAAAQRVVGWISSIRWPSPPSWLGKIGGILGAVIPGTPVGAAAAVAPTRTGSSTTARSSSSRPRGAGPMGSGLAGAGGNTFIIYGATDPEGTARAIRRTLRGHARRQGGLAGEAEE